MSQLYCHARVAQRGHGFGNRLLPWARCRVFSRATGTPMLATRWSRLALGPLYRGGANAGSYAKQFLLIGLFDDLPEQVSGLRRLRLLATRERVAEPDDLVRPVAATTGIVVFEGWRDQFERLNGWQAAVREDLTRMTRPGLRQAVEPDPGVVLNVRASNDFPAVPEGAAQAPHGYRTPLSWFAECLALLRRHVRRDLPALVVSDGSDAQLAPLLALPSVRRTSRASAASDLLTAAGARVLLASGTSSFSAWAAFLGGMPTACIPGQAMDVWKIRRPDGAFLGELDPRDPAPQFLEQAAAALKGANPSLPAAS